MCIERAEKVSFNRGRKFTFVTQIDPAWLWIDVYSGWVRKLGIITGQFQIID